MRVLNILLVSMCLIVQPLDVIAGDNKHGKRSRGLNDAAMAELRAAGVDKYLGEFEPAVSFDVGNGWTRHVFDEAGGDGPICVAGTPYSVYTRIRNPKKVVLFMQGGGACWQDFYFCNILAEAQGPEVSDAGGIWTDKIKTDDGRKRSPIHNWSVVYMPYCDGSVFSGDNAVFDIPFGEALGVPTGIVRHHRGLRNASAGIDLAKSMFPNARKILLAGSSAGGVGAVAMAPFLTRMNFGNKARLRVYNDAGPVAINPFDIAGIQQRAADWLFGQFYPASCADCDDMGQGTALINWRLENDSTIREAFYSTDGDATNRFFLQVPTQEAYRGLILSEHGALHDAHPDRYRRFIRSGSTDHIALQSDEFYDIEADGESLYRWMKDFIRGKDAWDDIVEDFIPLPQP